MRSSWAALDKRGAAIIFLAVLAGLVGGMVGGLVEKWLDAIFIAVVLLLAVFAIVARLRRRSARGGPRSP